MYDKSVSPTRCHMSVRATRTRGEEGRREQGAGSRGQREGTGSRKDREESKERKEGSREQGGMKQGAMSREKGTGSREQRGEWKGSKLSAGISGGYAHLNRRPGVTLLPGDGWLPA